MACMPDIIRCISDRAFGHGFEGPQTEVFIFNGRLSVCCGMRTVWKGYSCAAAGGRSGSGRNISGRQQTDEGSFRVWGQYSDNSHGKLYWFLEYTFSPYCSISDGCGILCISPCRKEIRKKRLLSVCSFSDSSIYCWNGRGYILKAEQRSRSRVYDFRKRGG